MIGQHAVLSPSAAHRWLSCPASVRLTAELEQDLGHDVVHSDSPYAAEGTLAHEIAEAEAAYYFGLIDTEEYETRLARWRARTPEAQWEEMLRHAASYVDLLDRMAREQPHSQVRLERRVDTGVPSSWGTLDAAVISSQLRIVDYKYGMGIAVDAYENEQLMLYALGAIDLYRDLADFEVVCCTIHQPRIGHTSHFWTTVAELQEWRDQVVKPAAALALSGEGHFAPSESACRFCPAAGHCRARVEFLTRRDFGNPDVLSPDELGEILHQVPDIENWCKAVRETALHLAYNDGIDIPGWKVVRSGGRRVITDQEAAIESLLEAGFPAPRVSRRSIQTLGALERVVGGKGALSGILGSLLQVQEGKVALVPEDDKRPAIDATADAGRDFKEGES